MVNDYHVRIVVEDSPLRYYREVQTDTIDSIIVDPSTPGISVRDFVLGKTTMNIPTCEGNVPSDMTIRTNVGSAIVNDDYVVTADPDNKKWIKISEVRDSGGNLEILAFEKVLGDYDDIPSGKSLEKDLKEFSVVAAGTVLVEEKDWI